MIDDKLKERIIPNLKRNLAQESWNDIEYMFHECYKYTRDDIDVVVLHPLISDGDMTYAYSILTGSFVEMASWAEAKKDGIKL